MNGDNQKTRYHAEVHVTLEGREARINVFADTLVEVFRDIGVICAQFPANWKSPAVRDIVNAERKAAQLDQKGTAAGQAKATGESPVCASCGSSEFMELIEFPDKKTGELRRAWKCQECHEWHWPNGRPGKGR